MAKHKPTVHDRDPRFEGLADANPEALTADGYDEAYLGYTSLSGIAVYSRRKCIEILVERDSMDWDEAEEFFSFNTEGAHVGEFTPLYIVEPEEVEPKPKAPAKKRKASVRVQ